MSDEGKAEAAEADRIVKAIMAKTASGHEFQHLPIAVMCMLSTHYAALKLRDGARPEEVQYILVNSADIGFCMARDIHQEMKG
jgi:hypothetical protein